MRVLILSAGEGKRLRPHTVDKPKCLVPINGIPLIMRQLNLYKHNKFEVVVVGGWQVSQIRGLPADVVENPLFSSTNMVYTLYCARHLIEGEVIIAYGDIAFSPSVLWELIDSKADIATVVDSNWKEYWSERSDNPLEDLETMRINDSHFITTLGEKVKSFDEIQGQYIGLTRLTSRGSSILKKILIECQKSGSINGKRFEISFFTDLLQELIVRNNQVLAVKIDKPWVEIDTTDDLESQITVSRISHIDREIGRITEK